MARTRHAPADNGRLQRAAGFVIVPTPAVVVADERQLIRAAVVFTKYLDRQAGRRDSRPIEFSQSSFACCHVIFPAFQAARTRRFDIPARYSAPSLHKSRAPE